MKTHVHPTTMGNLTDFITSTIKYLTKCTETKVEGLKSSKKTIRTDSQK